MMIVTWFLLLFDPCWPNLVFKSSFVRKCSHSQYTPCVGLILFSSFLLLESVLIASIQHVLALSCFQVFLC